MLTSVSMAFVPSPLRHCTLIKSNGISQDFQPLAPDCRIFSPAPHSQIDIFCSHNQHSGRPAITAKRDWRGRLIVGDTLFFSGKLAFDDILLGGFLRYAGIAGYTDIRINSETSHLVPLFPGEPLDTERNPLVQYRIKLAFLTGQTPMLYETYGFGHADDLYSMLFAPYPNRFAAAMDLSKVTLPMLLKSLNEEISNVTERQLLRRLGERYSARMPLVPLLKQLYKKSSSWDTRGRILAVIFNALMRIFRKGHHRCGALSKMLFHLAGSYPMMAILRARRSDVEAARNMTNSDDCDDCCPDFNFDVVLQNGGYEYSF